MNAVCNMDCMYCYYCIIIFWNKRSKVFVCIHFWGTCHLKMLPACLAHLHLNRVNLGSYSNRNAFGLWFRGKLCCSCLLNVVHIEASEEHFMFPRTYFLPLTSRESIINQLEPSQQSALLFWRNVMDLIHTRFTQSWKASAFGHFDVLHNTYLWQMAVSYFAPGMTRFP